MKEKEGRKERTKSRKDLGERWANVENEREKREKER